MADNNYNYSLNPTNLNLNRYNLVNSGFLVNNTTGGLIHSHNGGIYGHHNPNLNPNPNPSLNPNPNPNPNPNKMASATHTILSSILEHGHDGNTEEPTIVVPSSSSSSPSLSGATAQDNTMYVKGLDQTYNNRSSLNVRPDMSMSMSMSGPGPGSGSSIGIGIGIIPPSMMHHHHHHHRSSCIVKSSAHKSVDGDGDRDRDRDGDGTGSLVRHASLPADVLSQLACSSSSSSTTSTRMSTRPTPMDESPPDTAPSFHVNMSQLRPGPEPSHACTPANDRVPNPSLIRHRSSPAGLIMSELSALNSDFSSNAYSTTSTVSERRPLAGRHLSGDGVGLLNYVGRKDRVGVINMSDMNRGWSVDIEASSNMETSDLDNFGQRKRGRDLETEFFKPLQGGDLLHLGPLNSQAGSCEPHSHFLVQGSDFDMNDASDAVLCKSRAKRGCATHPRSIAERVRRTKISDRVKKLTDLVPNLDRQAHTADMLDEVVEYVKQLQQEVEELSENARKCNCQASKNTSLKM